MVPFPARRPGLLCAIGLSLWSAVGAGSQTPPTAALTTELRSHLKDDRFEIVSSIRGLPLGVRDALQTLFGSQSLDIAEPGAAFQGTAAAATPTRPGRRLVLAGCSRDLHCLVYYERGGAVRTWRAVLFHWTPAATRVEWGAAAPGGLATIEDVRHAILSGAGGPTITDW